MDIAIANTTTALQTWMSENPNTVVHSIIMQPSGYEPGVSGVQTAHPQRFVIAHTLRITPTGVMRDRVNTGL